MKDIKIYFNGDYIGTTEYDSFLDWYLCPELETLFADDYYLFELRCMMEGIIGENLHDEEVTMAFLTELREQQNYNIKYNKQSYNRCDLNITGDIFKHLQYELK